MSVQAQAAVVDRHVFYNDSPLDGGTPGASPQDDNAIAAAVALMPGDTGSGANCTAYSKGLNGIMVDIDGLANPGGLSLATISDYFGFKVGTSGDPSGWASAPTPTALDVRSVGGNSRVTIIWADNAIEKQWLQVTVKAGTATGLAEDDVFYFANLPGDANGDRTVSLADLSALAGNWGSTDLIAGPSVGDFNVDGQISLADLSTLAAQWGSSLAAVTFPEPAGSLNTEPVTTGTVAPSVDSASMTVEQEPTPLAPMEQQPVATAPLAEPTVGDDGIDVLADWASGMDTTMREPVEDIYPIAADDTGPIDEFAMIDLLRPTQNPDPSGSAELEPLLELPL